MQSRVLETPIEKLVNIVKINQNITINQISLKLKIPLEIIERWIVILDENNILKVTYRGFEGYVNYIEKIDKKTKTNEPIDIENIKKTFLTKAKLKNFLPAKTQKLWIEFIKVYENEIKDLFVDKAKNRGYPINKIEIAWIKYKKELEEL